MLYSMFVIDADSWANGGGVQNFNNFADVICV